MNHPSTFALLVCLVLGNYGCAAIAQTWTRDNCNALAAEAAGINAARSGERLDIQTFKKYCPIENNDEVVSAYMSGYKQGMVAEPFCRHKRTPAKATSPSLAAPSSTTPYSN